MKKALESGDLEQIKAKTEALKQAQYKMSEELYKNAAPGQGADGQPGPGAAEGGPFGSKPFGADANGPAKGGTADDVDYRVVDEEEKK